MKRTAVDRQQNVLFPAGEGLGPNDGRQRRRLGQQIPTNEEPQQQQQCGELQLHFGCVRFEGDFNAKTKGDSFAVC